MEQIQYSVWQYDWLCTTLSNNTQLYKINGMNGVRHPDDARPDAQQCGVCTAVKLQDSIAAAGDTPPPIATPPALSTHYFKSVTLVSLH